MKQDEDLLEAWLTREDRAALDELFGRHYPGVYQVVLRIVHDETDARDVAQATFLKALRKAPTVRQKDRFRYWLLRIAVNEARQHHRRARPTASLDDLAEVFTQARRASAVREAGRREFEIELERALETMPESLKTPLVLHYYQSLSLAEVAHVLELPKSTVQSRCERAMALLRKRFVRSRHRALVPLLAVRFPDLAAEGASATTPVAAGALAVKSWILLAAAILAAAWLLVGLTDTFKSEAPPPRDGADRTARARPGQGDPGTIPGPGLVTTGARSRAAPGVGAGASRRVVSSGTGVISGRVIALATGRGVAGASVCITPGPAGGRKGVRKGEEGWFENTYVSDAQGRFTCDRLPVPGVYDLCVRRSGFGYAERFGVQVPKADGRADLGIVFLRDGASLSGRVLDAVGHPVRGAQVSAGTWREAASPEGFRLAGRALRGARTLSGADGRFRLEGLAPGAHRVLVSAAGHATAALAAVVVPARRELEVVLRRQPAAAGRVVDEDGRPVAGVRVELWIAETRRRGSYGLVRRVPWAVLRSGPQGDFPLAGLPGGVGFELVIEGSSEGYHDAHLEVPIPEGGTVLLTLRRKVARQGVTVRVRPLPQEGPLPRDAVGLLTLGSEDAEDDLEAHLDTARGVFEIEAVPPGRWYARALVRGFAPATATIQVGPSGLDRDLALSKGQVLEGQVVDGATGKAVPGATVAWSQGSVYVATADEAGRYRLEGPTFEAGRTYTGAFSAQAPGYLPRSFPVRGEAGRVTHRDVRLVPRSALRTVRGVVRDEAGSPVLGARVALQVNDGRGTWHAATTDPEGRFAIEGLDPSHLGPTLRLRVVHPHYAPLLRGAPEVAGESRAPLELVLERGRRVEGRVLDTRGQPVAGATVGYLGGATEPLARTDDEYIVWSLREALQQRATTDAEGRFVMERVPSREGLVLAFQAHARWVSRAGASSHLALAPGVRVEGLELRLEMGRRVDGTVVDEDGRPVAGAVVRAEGVTVGACTDVRGWFDLTPVFDVPTPLAVTARSPGAKARLEIAAADLHGLRIVLRATGTLTGRVLDERGAPVAKAVVSLRGEDGTDLGGAATDATGAFTVADAYAGPAKLEIRRRADQGVAPATVAVTVLAGQVTAAGEIRLR